MGLILDSSVVIAAERRRDTIEQFIQHLVSVTGDEESALSVVAVAELVHGIYRAELNERRQRREHSLKACLPSCQPTRSQPRSRG